MTASKSVPDTLSAMLDSPSSSTASTQPLQSKLTVSSTKSAGTRPVSAVDPDDRKPMSQNPSVKKSNLSTRPASSVDPDAGDDDELFGAKGRKKNDQMSLADFLRETEPPPMISSIGSQQMLNEKSGSSSGKKKNNGIMNFLGNLSKSRNELSPSPSSKNNESLFGTAKSDSSRDLQSAGSYAPSIANSTSTSSSNLEGMTIDKKKYSMIQQKGPTPSPLQQQNSNTTNGSHSNTNISNNAGQVASANTTIPQQQQPLAAAPSNSNMPRSSSSNNKENMTSNAAPSNNTTSPGATPVLAPIVATSPTQTRRASFTEMKPMTLMTASNAPPVPPVPVQYGERVARVPSAGSLTSLGGPPGRSKSVNRVQQLIGSQSDLSQGSRGSNNTPPSSRRTRPRPTLNLPESLPDIYAAPLEKVFKQLIQINEKFAVVMDIKGEARKTSMSSLNTPGSPTSSSSIPRSQRKLIKLPSATSSPVGGAPQDIGSPVYNVRRHVFSQTENNVCMESDTQTEDLSGEEEAEECDDVYGKNAKPKALLSEHQSTSTSTATGQWSASKSTSRETSPLQHTLSSVAAVVTLATTEASTSTMAETVEKETTVSSCTSCEDSKRKLERLEIDHFARGLVGKMIQRVIIQKVVPKRKIAQTQTSPPAELVETELQTMPIQFKVEEDDMLKEKALHELANQNNQLLDEITSLRMEVARERASRDSLSIEKDTMSKRFEALAKISLGVLRSEHEKRYEVEVDLWEKTS